MIWADKIAPAQRQIREGFRNRRAQIVKQGGTSGPAHNPVRLDGVSHDCIIGELQIKQMEITSGLVQQTDRKFMVSTEGLTVAPEVQDKFVVDGEELSITMVEPLQPGGEVIFWKVYASGA